MYRTENEIKIDVTRRLVFLGVLIALLLTIGTLFYHFTEAWSITDSLYFSTISLTARGFSDLRPTHWYSVLFSVFYLLFGVAFLIYGLSSLVSYYTAFYEEKLHRFVRRMKSNGRQKEKWLMLRPKKKS